MDQKYVESTLELIDFINDSPSCYHVVSNVAAILENAGCIKLEEDKRFTLEPECSYYVTRNSSAIIAFRVPASESADGAKQADGASDAKQAKLQPAGFSIVAAHTDSPSFKVKANPELPLGEAYTTINVEGYGGMLMAPWFDRPLSLAGRAFIKTNDGLIEQYLVDFDHW